jgi:hypothetical protein
MRRSHIIVFVSFMAILVAPHFSYAALTGLNTAIFPAQCTCTGLAGSGSTYPSAPDFGCVLQVIDNLMSAVVAFSTLIITIFIARAGFMFMTSPNSEEAKVKARNSLVNAVIGILIVLAAYLLIDSILKVIYNSDASFQNGSGQAAELGPWNALLSPSGAQNCLVQQKPPGITTAVGQLANTTANAGGGSTASNPSQNTRGDCTASGLQSDGMNSSISSTMSCITKSEDTSCALGAKSGTDIGTDKQSVSIGMFQINISANNLSQYPACEAAVNNQPLNCTQAFSGGVYTASNHQTHVSGTGQNLYNTCVSAASNPQCNVQAAQDQYLNKGGSKNWGTTAQHNCGS